MVWPSGGTSARRRSIHQPRPANAPPTIGPTARRTGLLPVIPSQQRAEGVVVSEVLDEAQHDRRRQSGDPGEQADDDYRTKEVEVEVWSGPDFRDTPADNTDSEAVAFPVSFCRRSMMTHVCPGRVISRHRCAARRRLRQRLNYARAEPVATTFIVLQDIDPTIEADIRYFTAHNFTGDPVDGYRAPLCILTRVAAEGLRVPAAVVGAWLRAEGVRLLDALSTNWSQWHAMWSTSG